MFEVIKIKHIRQEDLPLMGKNLVSLAKLAQKDLMVADGIIVLPPHLKLKTVIEHYEKGGKEVFEQSLTLIKSKIHKIEIPEELEEVLVKEKIDAKKVWVELLDTWLSEIRSIIWREGFSPNLAKRITAQPVFYTKRIEFSGQAYFDNVEKKSEIEATSNLTVEQTLFLDELIKKCDKVLFFPHVYTFIYDGEFKIVKVREFTEHKVKSDLFQKPLEGVSKEYVEKNKQKSTIKVFLNATEGLVVDRNIDGIILDSERLIDLDTKTWKFSELATDFSQIPAIYKLADLRDENNIRGALRLIHQKSLLQKEAEVFLFARNKKNLFNTQIAIPYVRSCQEFLQLKRDLASLGISRKGSLKLWMEIAVPENIINLDEYLVAGFDGALINLDSLAELLGGFVYSGEENNLTRQDAPYVQQVQALLKFLDSGLKLLKKSGIPVLLTGELVTHDEVIRFLVEKGLFGIVVTIRDSYFIQEHLRFVENRVIKARA